MASAGRQHRGGLRRLRHSRIKAKGVPALAQNSEAGSPDALEGAVALLRNGYSRALRYLAQMAKASPVNACGIR
jgi:hypothetical protein